jgi:glycosyltransferase involved in cell wall biosynthesis
MKPKVSILLLTFNTLTKVGEKFTKFMIESIFRQDHPNLTHIVIDNHSQDNTLAYLEKLTSNYASTEFHIIKLAMISLIASTFTPLTRIYYDIIEFNLLSRYNYGHEGL